MVEETKDKFQPSINVDKQPATKKNDGKFTKKFDKKPKSNNNYKKSVKEKPYQEKVIAINRVTKVTKGGRQFRFAAIVVIGDKKGKVGVGTGKANEVPDAIKKAIKSAEKTLVQIPIIGTTIPHEIIGNYGGGKILMKPAKPGKGIIAGGPVRLIMELSGIQDIYSKSLRSNTPINMIRATLKGFQQLKTAEHFLRLKDKLPFDDEQKNKE